MKKLLILILLLAAANSIFSQTSPVFDIEGHRGTRGLMPENTIPAFLKAIDLGVDTLELDLQVSLDKQLIVSHDSFFAAAFSLDKNGLPIPKDKEMEYNIYKMNYSEVKLFDVGSFGNKDFPEQQKLKVYKPLLRDVFKETQKYIRRNKLKPVRYNIEIKCTPAGDNIFHPVPAVFAKMVYDEIRRAKMEKYVIIQSFDVRPLREMKKFPVKFPISLLVQNKDGIAKNIENLGFQPDIYSPHFSLVDEATVNFCHQKSIKIVPWTVNEIADLEAMKKLNLDGLITDYPNRATKVFRN